jgi:hypothetical protein
MAREEIEMKKNSHGILKSICGFKNTILLIQEK